MRSFSVCGFSAAIAVCAAMAGAATINVGPTRTYTTVQAGVNAAGPGDTVMIDPGTYIINSPVTWTTDNLTIKGNGGRPVLNFSGIATAAAMVAGTSTAPVTNVTFDSLEAVGPQGTPAWPNDFGIVCAHWTGTATLNNCVFHDALCAVSLLDIHNGGYDSVTHNANAVVTNCHMYNGKSASQAFVTIGPLASFRLQGSWIHNSHTFDVRTYAYTNYFFANRLGDEQGWSGPYAEGNAVSVANGGLTYVIGNVFLSATNSASGIGLFKYADLGLGASYNSQIYVVYNTVALNRDASATFLLCTNATLPAYVANNAVTHDGAGQLVNGPMVNNSAMINSNLVLYLHQGNNPLGVHRFCYDSNGYDGDGNYAAPIANNVVYDTWDVLNVRPVDPNTFPFGAGCSNTTSKMPLSNGYQTVLSPGAGVGLLVPGSNPLALPATGTDGTSLTPTSQFSNMPQVAGVAGGTETRPNATDAIGAYAFVVPPQSNHQPVGTITSTMPPFIYEGSMVHMTATATDQDVGQTLSYVWSQTTGQPQTLVGATSLNASFTAPAKSLTSKANKILTFQFVATDSYVPPASSTPVTASVTCYLCGDLDHDDAVTLADLKLLVGAWNSTPSSGNWNLAADIDGDGAVTLADLKLLVANWNRSIN